MLLPPHTSSLAFALPQHSHLLLAQSFLHFQSPCFYHVPVDENNLVHGVVIIKLNKSASSLLSSVIPSHLLDIRHFPVLFKVISNILIFHFISNSSNEYLFDTGLCLWLTSICSWSSSLSLQSLATKIVRSGSLAVIKLRCLVIGNKPESTRSARVIEFHDNTINKLSKLFKMSSQLLLSCLIIESPYEQLSHRLTLRINLFIVIP